VFRTIDLVDNSLQHPYIVLTSPDAEGNIVFVMMTKNKHHLETTTPFEVGDYPFVIYPSHISYRDLKIREAAPLEDALNANVVAQRAGSISTVDLARITTDVLAQINDAKIRRAIEADIADAANNIGFYS